MTRKARRPRFYALERDGRILKIHTFRTPDARDEWVHVKSRESILIGDERIFTALKSDDLRIRRQYRFSRSAGCGFAYQEH